MRGRVVRVSCREVYVFMMMRRRTMMRRRKRTVRLLLLLLMMIVIAELISMYSTLPAFINILPSSPVFTGEATEVERNGLTNFTL